MKVYEAYVDYRRVANSDYVNWWVDTLKLIEAISTDIFQVLSYTIHWVPYNHN